MKPHEFTYKNKKYGLRAVDKDGTSYGGFQNNLEIGGVTTAPDWCNDNECGGGIHFWPLGIGRFGKDINNHNLLWVVISYEECVDLQTKCKAPSVITEFVGNQADAMSFLGPMIKEYAKVTGVTTNSGNSGCGGVAANNDDYGIATNNGYCGVAANSGNYGIAANSGNFGVATNSALRGVAANSGNYGVATNSGDRGIATNSGSGGVAANSGSGGVATNSGYHGVATNSGDYGVATNSGSCGVATNHGQHGIAASTGQYSQVFAEHGIACTTEKNTLLGGKNGVMLVWHTKYGSKTIIVTPELEGKMLSYESD